MIRPSLRGFFAIAVAAVALCGIGTAYGQYSKVGTTSGGGNIVIGTGTALGNLGPGSPLSANGSDSITFEPGSIALGSGSDTVQIATSNDTLANYGTILGAATYNAVSFLSGSSLTAETITNNGVITVISSGTISGNVGVNSSGNYDAGFNAGAAVAVTSSSGIGTVTLSNAGTITGGGIGSISSGNVGVNYTNFFDAGFNAGAAVAVTSGSGIGTVTLSNAGTITGGGIGSISSGNVGVNSSGVFDTGFNVGAAVAVTSGSGIGTVTLSNAGTITGGGIGSISSGNVGADFSGFFDTGFNIGAAVAVTSSSGIGTVTLSNAGTITGGGIGSISSGYVGADFSSSDGAGFNIGAAVAVTSSSGIGTVTLSNAGTITGGGIGSISSGNVGTDLSSSGDAGFNIGAAVAVTSSSGIGTVTLSNAGTITGGSIGSIGGSEVGYNNGSSNVGFNVCVGVAIASGGAINNLSLFNYGSISGGNIGSVDIASTLAPDAASAIVIQAAAAGGNLGITNYGIITGGNVGSGAPAGYGIVSDAGNLVINNYGAISAGAGPAEPGLPSGFPNVAVSISGNNNTINLNGHSSVNGTLQGAGSNNVLNLKFTGVSPAALASLKAQLAAQGYPATNNFTGSFTLRGQTYYVDPLILNLGGITSYEGQAQTPNQFAVGANLDSLAYNPMPGSSFGNLLNAIDASGAVPQALEALSPQGYEIYGDLAIANANEMVLSVDKRLNNLRDGSENIDTTGLGGGSDQATTAGYSKDSDGKESKTIVQPSAPEKRWGFFAAGDGLLFRGDPRDVDLQSGKSDNAGAITGVDGKVGENGVVGLLAAYNNSDATFGTENSTAKIDSYSGGVYGSWHDDGFYVNGLAAYTRNDYSSTRNIVFPGFSSIGFGQTHGDQATVNVDGGYDWHATDRVTLGPLLGLQYVNLGVNGFNEVGGSAADLAVGRQEVNSLQSRVGFRADYHLQLEQNVAFATELTAAWQHEYLDASRAIDADFIATGLDPFSVQTSSPLRDAAVVSLGVNFTFHDRLTLFGDYSLLMWDAGYFEQTFSGGLKISF